MAPRARRRPALVPCGGAAARRIRVLARLHARRADAGHRAPVLRLVGIPNHRLLRADRALRQAAGLHVSRRRPASGRHRRDPRLGAVAFPGRRHGLSLFDGTHLYEHADRASGLPPRVELAPSSTTGATRCARSSSRARSSGSTDTTSTACASMRSPRCCTSTTARAEGEWIPNPHGGRENLEATEFLRQLNTAIYRDHPTCRRSRKSPPPGRWCRGPWTRGASGSA